MTNLSSRRAPFHRALLLLVIGSLLPLVARAQNLNVLNNGGFELTTFNAQAASSGYGAIEGAVPSNPRRASVPNWTWAPAPGVAVSESDPLSTSVFISHSSGFPEGSKAAIFGGGSYNGGGSITQRFDATAGSTYRVSFWVQRIGATETIGGLATIRNYANSAVVASVAVDMSSAPSGVWRQVTFTFTAPSNDLAFTFADTTPVNSAPGTDLGLDHVSIETLSPQSLTILGANGSPGSIEANTDYSKDGGVTWHPAYLFTGHPWGYIAGTNAWLNQNPSPFVGLNDRVDFRIRFYVPDAWAAAHMTYQVNADNEADILVNGTQAVHTVGGPISSGTLPTQYLIPGINTIYVRLIDYGGWVGLNYRIDISMDTSAPIERIAPPPSITSPLTATGTVGSSFNYTIQATNSPTSRTASNLPPGLTVNPSTGLISGTPTTAGTYNVTLTATNNFGSGSNTLVLTIGRGTASVTLNNLVHTYSGGVKSAGATTNPGGLPVNFSYTGASLPPVNAGSYGVFASISHANYTGFTNGTLLINKAPASVTLANLIQPYNGSPRPVSVTTSPAGLATSVTYNGSTSAPTAVGLYTVAASVTNPNYTGSASASLRITDSTKPALTLPASPIVAEATGPDGANVAFTVSALDDIDGSVLVTTTAASGSKFPLGDTVVTATAQDAAGNIAQGTFTVTVRDTTAPVISLASPEPDLLSENFSAYTGIHSGTQHLSGLNLAYGGNVSGWSATGGNAVHVVDLSGSGNYAVMIWHDNVITRTAATAANDAGVAYVVKFVAGPAVYQTPSQATGANDGLKIQLLRADNTVAVEFSHKPGAYAGASTMTPVSFNYTGDGTGSLRVRIAPLLVNSTRFGGAIDELSIAKAPVALTTPQEITVEATSSAGAPATFNAVATDLVSGNVTVSASPVSGSTFPVGTTLVTLGAIDAAGNPATATFNVIVRDTTKPVLNLPANQTLEATSAAGAIATFNATASDNVGATVTTSAASGSTFPLGTTTVNVTASDAAGNSASGSFTITVRDTTKPVVTAPASMIVEATSAAGASVPYSASATDAVSGSVPVTGVPASGSTFALGTSTVGLSAVDAAGNVGTASFTITVRDTSKPTLTAPGNLVIEATSAAGATVNYTASATDTVSGNIAVVGVPASGTVFPIGSTTVNLTATDAAGNFATASFTVTVRDTVKPVLTLPASPIVVEATGPSGANVTFGVSANDNINGAVAVTTSHASGSLFPLGETVVNADAQDAAGNAITGSFLVTVVDTTAPTILMSPTASIGVTINNAGFEQPAVSDHGTTIDGWTKAGDSGVVYVPALPGRYITGVAPEGRQVAFINIGSISQTLGVTLEAGKTYTLSGYVGRRSDDPITTGRLALVTTSGVVLAQVDSASDQAVATFAHYTTTFTAPANHPNLGAALKIVLANTSNQQVNFDAITLMVGEAPTSAPADIVAEATSASGAVVNYTTGAIDIVSGTLPASSAPVSGGTFPIGSTVVTLGAIDPAGNPALATFNVIVRDTTNPVLNLPANQTLEATSAAGAVAIFNATATDAVGAIVTTSAASGSAFPLGTTTVDVSAIDEAGNETTGSFTITVIDSTKPMLSLPANQVIEATGPAGAIATFSASASDTVDGGLPVSLAPESGSVFAIGTTAVQASASDSAGNTASGAFTITVTDTTAPVIAPLDNLVVEATGADGAVVEFTPSALDIVDGAVSVTASPASGSTFALGETLVTLTALDSAGNSVTSSFTVTVVDTTAPVIATPANLVAEATSAAGAVVVFDVSASDIVDGVVAVNASHASGSVFPIGTTTVTIETIDATGNASSSSFTITVQDTTAPVIATIDNQTLEATGPAGAIATFAAIASDAVGANVSYSIAPGSTFVLGTTTVVVTAADAAGNTSNASFTIVVRDTTAPTLFPPVGQTLEATSAAGATASYSATALDVVSGHVPVAFSIDSGSTFPLGSTTVVASTIDAAGNATSAVFSIVVVDTTAPVITAPANIVLEATGASGAIATFSASALDIVSGNVAVSFSKSSGSVFALGATAVVLTATDVAGNTSTAAFNVTVIDTTAPTITVPEDIVIDSSTVMGATATYSASATDIVDGALTVTLSKASGTIFPIGTTVVTATVADAAGNTATKTFSVTVRAPAAALVNQISGMNGTINGSIQQRTNHGVTLNGGAAITGELLAVGTPATRLNGKPAFGGSVDSTGSTNPSGYTITLNGNARLGKLVRRFDAIAMPIVAAPSNPTGSRSVNVNRSADPIGAWSTLRNLTLNGNVGSVTVPAGVYGNFTANGGSGFTLGVAGATTPSVYHFQNLTLNGNSAFKVVGPVILIVKNGINVNASMGSSANPAWLDLRISNGGLTLNGNVNVDGYVTAPSGTVTINGNSELRGGLVADKLVLNGNSDLTLLRR